MAGASGEEVAVGGLFLERGDDEIGHGFVPVVQQALHEFLPKFLVLAFCHFTHSTIHHGIDFRGIARNVGVDQLPGGILAFSAFFPQTLEGFRKDCQLLFFSEFSESDQLRLGFLHACGFLASGGSLFPKFHVQGLSSLQLMRQDRRKHCGGPSGHGLEWGGVERRIDELEFGIEFGGEILADRVIESLAILAHHQGRDGHLARRVQRNFRVKVR